ncbi:MAG: copper resistance protein NlpE [Tannerellaceae bacterium]|nr:copper resistance protein NlpE [Tannerellaceae bacterium]
MKRNDVKDDVVVDEETVMITESDDDLYLSDVDGVYEGKLPTASGEGMKVTITLEGDTYKKSVIYIGKSNEPVTTSGNFTWNDEGSVITLTGEELPNQYAVGEDILTHLDMDGKEITGNLAKLYILKKK